MDSIPLDVSQKQCIDCKGFFPATIDYFYKHPTGRNGLFACCKTCHRIRGEHSMQKPEVRDKAHARGRTNYYANKKRYLEQHKQWYQENKEYMAEYYRQLREEQPELLAERWQNWYQTENGKEHSRTRVRNRRVRRKGAEGNYTHADIEQKYIVQKGRCYYCKTKIAKGKAAYHIDHVTPLSRGGTNWPDNLVLTCPTCNMSKSDRLPHEWPEGGRLF